MFRPTLNCVLLLLAACLVAPAQGEKPAPDFQEVYQLIRTHLTGVSEAELNRAAVQALVSKLAPKVAMAGADLAGVPPGSPLVTQSNLFEGPIAYIRVSRVAEGLDRAMREAYREVKGTNQLQGIVLDLRYAGGDDYEAAAGAADVFLSKAVPLLDWGNGVVRSREKNDAIRGPLAVLINPQTTGAPEALAAILRETGVALVLGNPTAGNAMVAKEYALKNGDRLKIATTPVAIGETLKLAGQAVKPDIAVEVSEQAERAYFADAFKEIFRGIGLSSTNQAASSGASTNRVRRPRFNEAELVRERRNTSASDLDASAQEAELERPVVKDPVLARALDLLKGLAVVRPPRS
jgi:hypothetical protein